MKRPALRTLSAIVLLLGASTPAWASYRDGFFGLVMLYFGVPSALLALFIAGFLRATGLFKRRLWQRAFQTLVGVPAGGVMVWVLFSNDGPSTAMVWIGYPLLVALATAPSWWRLPEAGPPFRAPQSRLRRAVGLYWLISGLVFLVQHAPVLLRAAAGRDAMPPLALLAGLALFMLVFEGPRLVGGAILLRRWQGAAPWLAASVLVTFLSLAWGLVRGAPLSTMPFFGVIWLIDLGLWALVRQRAALTSHAPSDPTESPP